MTTSPKQNSGMLLAHPSAPLGHGHGHQQHAIRSPSRHGSPKLASLSLAESSSHPPSPSSSSLIIDNQGQLHDPGYQSALRLLHAQIGARASPQPGKRPSSSGNHAPSRPSHLGLSLSGHESSHYHDSFSSSDDNDSTDDEVDGELESYSTMFDEARRADRSGSLSSVSNTHALNLGSRPSSPPTIRTPPPPSVPSSSSRHLSFSTNHTDGPSGSPNENRSRRASWASKRRSSSGTRASPKAQTESDRKGASGWGFTGLVDLERAQRAARESLDVNSDSVESNDARLSPPSSRRCSRSLLRKGSSSSNSNNSPGLNGERSLGLSIHSGGSQGNTGVSSPNTFKSSAIHRHPSLSSLTEAQPRHYSTVDNEKGALSTIMSGKPLAEDESSDQWSAVSDLGASDYKKLNAVPVDLQLQQQQEEADFIVGPSKYKQSKETFKKKAQDLSDASTHQHEFRRKVENLALGVRFGAFKAKRRLERSING